MRDQKLGPERRIKQRPDFLRIQTAGDKFRTKNILLVTSPQRAIADGSNAGGAVAQSRIGITVTTKVHKRAVRRNKFKRRIRELFRKERENFAKTTDLVVIALDGACELSFLQLAKQFKYLLYRSGVLAEKRPNSRSSGSRSSGSASGRSKRVIRPQQPQKPNEEA